MINMYPDKIKKCSSISLFFPAYNEEANIAKSINQALTILPQFAEQYEIIVVDDGSKDKTAEIVQQVASKHPQVRLIQHDTNVGYGGAVKSGIYGSRFDLIFLCDADLQFDLTEMPRMLEWINEYDLVVGYRVKRKDPFHRRVNALCWHLLIHILLSLKVKDIDCAFKLFRKSIFQNMKLSSNGAMVSTEILAQARSFGYKIKEIPVSHYPRLEGEQSGANPKVVFKAFRDLFKFYREMKKSGKNH